MTALIPLASPLGVVGDGVVVVVVVWTGLHKLVAQHEADTLVLARSGKSEAAAQRFVDAQPKKVPGNDPLDKFA